VTPSICSSGFERYQDAEECSGGLEHVQYEEELVRRRAIRSRSGAEEQGRAGLYFFGAQVQNVKKGPYSHTQSIKFKLKKSSRFVNK
jgi:hypothetical protein